MKVRISGMVVLTRIVHTPKGEKTGEPFFIGDGIYHVIPVPNPFEGGTEDWYILQRNDGMIIGRPMSRWIRQPHDYAEVEITFEPEDKPLKVRLNSGVSVDGERAIEVWKHLQSLYGSGMIDTLREAKSLAVALKWSPSDDSTRVHIERFYPELLGNEALAVIRCAVLVDPQPPHAVHLINPFREENK